MQSISLVNTGTGELFHNGLGFKFLELPKFGKKEDELENELDIARKMKEDNFELAKIARFTALSMEEIESL